MYIYFFIIVLLLFIFILNLIKNKNIKKNNIEIINTKYINSPNIYSNKKILIVKFNINNNINLLKIKNNITGINRLLNLNNKVILLNNNEIVLEYNDKETQKKIIKYAIEKINNRFNEKEISDLKKIYEENNTGPSMNCIIDELNKNYIPYRRIGNNSLIIAGQGNKQKFIQASTTHNTKFIAEAICKNKHLTKEILESICLPIPNGFIVDNENDLIKHFNELKSPVVVKPFDGNQGKNVTVNITNVKDLLIGYIEAKKKSDKIIIEKYIKGYDYRLLIINNKFIAASKRTPPFVIGNSFKTIKELIDEINLEPDRGEDHGSPLTKIKIDDILINYIKNQGLNINSILPVNKKIFLRQNANLSSGGTAEDVTKKVHPKIIEYAIMATNQVGLDICGLDVVCEDISKSPDSQSFAFIEMNSGPGLRMHVHPSIGKPVSVGKTIVDDLFQDNGRIPHIVIVGDQNRKLAQKMIAESLKDEYKIGLENNVTDSLNNPENTCCITELSDSKIKDDGLGFENCTIGIFLNSDNLTGFQSQKILFSNIINTGYAILNCDDKYIDYLDILSKYIKCNIIYFSVNKNSKLIQKSISEGKIVAYYDNGNIIYKNRDKNFKIKINTIHAAEIEINIVIFCCRIILGNYKISQ